ncbi:stigma-specific STIG1-like protein 3 [Aristolochia californica]|uniref:stigma-specific STIG1-like protein 3 n=1 Tax=Aristolochia californica TaxID=171875 RepID=UPI0035DEC8B1
MKQPVKKILSIMLVTFLAFFVAHAAAATMDENEDAPTVVAEAEQEVDEEEGMLDFISLRGVNSHKMTCAQDPSICLVRGSPGKDCCKKACVDTNTDNRNCGGCKVKCKNSYECCQGLCVPPTAMTCNPSRLALREEV